VNISIQYLYLTPTHYTHQDELHANTP